MEVARARGLTSVSLISSSHSASRVFVSEAASAGIAVPRVLELSPRSSASPAELAEQVKMFLLHSQSSRPAVALVSAAGGEAEALAAHLRPEDLGGVRPVWLVCSVAGASAARRAAAWRRFFHGGVFVEPYMPELEDFKEYFVESLQVCFFPTRNLI